MIKNALIFRLGHREALEFVETLLNKHKIPYSTVNEVEQGEAHKAIMFDISNYKKSPAYITLASRLVEEGHGKGLTFVSALGVARRLFVNCTEKLLGTCYETNKDSIGDNYAIVLNEKYYAFK